MEPLIGADGSWRSEHGAILRVDAPLGPRGHRGAPVDLGALVRLQFGCPLGIGGGGACERVRPALQGREKSTMIPATHAAEGALTR